MSEDPRASSAFPEIVAGRYRLLRELGRGGMGAVYEAEHANTGERVALKTMLVGAGDAEFVERFRREARAFAKIGGEHVVRVIDADTAPELGGAPFLVMELLNGSDLARMSNHGSARSSRRPPLQCLNGHASRNESSAPGWQQGSPLPSFSSSGSRP